MESMANVMDLGIDLLWNVFRCKGLHCQYELFALHIWFVYAFLFYCSVFMYVLDLVILIAITYLYSTSSRFVRGYPR